MLILKQWVEAPVTRLHWGLKKISLFAFLVFLIAKIIAFKCSFDLNFQSLVVEFFGLATIQNRGKDAHCV